MQIKTTTTYMADDGTVFTNQKECEEYEKQNNIKEKLLAGAWNEIPKLEISEDDLHLTGCFDDIHYVVCCRDKKDILVANQFLRENDPHNSRDEFTEDDIGRRVVVSIYSLQGRNGLGEGWMRLGTPEEILEQYRATLMKPMEKEEVSIKLFRKIEMKPGEKYCVGDVISFSLNDGEKVEALAVKQEQDDMIFVLVDCLKQKYIMNHSMTNISGYEDCLLRKTLNGEILDRFPAEIREKMVAFTNGDLLRLPTEREIFGKNEQGEAEDISVEQWEPMKLRKNRIAFYGEGDDLGWYWLQNRADRYKTYFASVYGYGLAYCSNASTAYGVRPAFKIS